MGKGLAVNTTIFNEINQGNSYWFISVATARFGSHGTIIR
jgi:hypothetical protein